MKGSYNYNDNLSVRRAINVFSYLRSELGESDLQYRIIGMGKRRPIYLGKNLDKYILNRRVEVKFYEK